MLRRLIGRLLCFLGFHMPGRIVFDDFSRETVWWCSRRNCNGIYRDDWNSHAG